MILTIILRVTNHQVCHQKCYPWRNTAFVGANEKYDGKLVEDINIIKVLKKTDCILWTIILING